MGPRLILLDMGMIVDVILTVAVVSIAAGAVAELQLRISYIGSAADSAAMGVDLLGSRPFCPIGWGEGDRPCTNRFGLAASVDLCPPRKRQQIGDVFAEEEQIVGKTHQREQTVGEEDLGEAKIEQFDGVEQQIQQTQDPCFDRNDKENHKLCIGIERGIGDQERHIQIVYHLQGIEVLPGCSNDLCFLRKYGAVCGKCGTADHGKDIH